VVNFYTHTTWAQLKTALSLRLSDPNKVYWTDGELGLYLVEALRTWAVLTAYWRDTGVINSTASTPFYNLTSLLNADGLALLSNTTKDQDLVTRIQYHLLEPATGSSWTGSEQFTLADVTNSIQKRRDQLLADTGCVVTRTSGIALAPGTTRVFLSDSVIAIRRLAFTASIGGAVTPLLPSDILSQRNYASDELYTPNPPYSYSSASARPTEIVMVPPSNQPGTLDLVSVQTGAALNPAVGVVLGIPDDYTWVVKWGALADLLAKDGPARDQIRSAYCERRYQLGVELIKMTPVVVNAEINGVPLDTDSLTNTDAYNSSWQSTTGTPIAVASIRTLVALSPCPNGVYSTTFDVVCKTPIPAGILAQTTADDGAFVQIGREQLDAILDYSQHIASFKMAGEEFRATIKGAENFFNAALAYNERLASANPNVLTLMAQAFQDVEDRQYRVSGGLGALQGQPVSGGSATLNQSAPQNQANPEGE
jgi:hypothetical protein